MSDVTTTSRGEPKRLLTSREPDMAENALMSREQAQAIIEKVKKLSKADEVMVTTFLPETEDRRRMIEEMARVFDVREGWSPADAMTQVTP